MFIIYRQQIQHDINLQYLHTQVTSLDLMKCITLQSNRENKYTVYPLKLHLLTATRLIK